MKKTIMVLSLSTLVSCGAIDSLSKNCGNGAGCKFLFGKIDRDQDKKIEQNKSDLEKIKQELALLKVKVENLELADITINLSLSQLQDDINALEDTDLDLQTQIDALLSSLNSTISRVESLETSLTNVSSQINDLNDTDADLQAQIDDLASRLSSLENANFQDQINDVLAQIASLQTNGAVTKMFDPCGDHVGNFDEVILQTNTGVFMAYFESGSKRFLSVIGNGNYITTDNQSCHFTISGANISPATQL